MVLEPSTAFDS